MIIGPGACEARFLPPAKSRAGMRRGYDKPMAAGSRRSAAARSGGAIETGSGSGQNTDQNSRFTTSTTMPV
jgi:hypothetical protein